MAGYCTLERKDEAKIKSLLSGSPEVSSGLWARVFLDLGSRGNTPNKTILLSAENSDSERIHTTRVLLEPLRRLVGREESFRLCEMRTRTIGGTSEPRINLGLLGISVLARPGVSGFVWGYLLP